MIPCGNDSSVHCMAFSTMLLESLRKWSLNFQWNLTAAHSVMANVQSQNYFLPKKKPRSVPVSLSIYICIYFPSENLFGILSRIQKIYTDRELNANEPKGFCPFRKDMHAFCCAACAAFVVGCWMCVLILSSYRTYKALDSHFVLQFSSSVCMCACFVYRLCVDRFKSVFWTLDMRLCWYFKPFRKLISMCT